jgi:hypothetical protein
MTDRNTLVLLMATYRDAVVPLADICEKYFGLGVPKAKRAARMRKLPVPVLRLGDQKSPWMVRLTDLAEYIDNTSAQATKAWKQSQI